MFRTIKRAVFGPLGLALVGLGIGAGGIWSQRTGASALILPYLPEGTNVAGLGIKVAGTLLILALVLGALRATGVVQPQAEARIDPSDPYANLARPSYLADADAQPAARKNANPEWKKRLEKKMGARLQTPESKRRGGGVSLRGFALLIVTGLFVSFGYAYVTGGAEAGSANLSDLTAYAVESSRNFSFEEVKARFDPASFDASTFDPSKIDFASIDKQEVLTYAIDLARRTVADAEAGDPLARGYLLAAGLAAILVFWRVLRAIFGGRRRHVRGRVAMMSLN